MSLPLSFKFPKEIMVTPREVEYYFIGGILHIGNVHDGHYITYIRNPEGGFWEFNDSDVCHMTDGEALEKLERAYLLVYGQRRY
jgi:ubiquitin C-terminal hydrolase